MDNQEIPLKTWDLYFLNEEYTAFNKEISLIAEIKKKFKSTTSELKIIMDSGIFNCEYSFFEEVCCPANSIKCFSCAVSERIFEEFQQSVLIETRIINHPKVSIFSEITTSSVDTLVTIIGTCSRVGFKKIENLETYFECLKCSKILKVQNQGNVYKNPRCSCKSKSFIFLSSHPGIKCIDKQEIKIQEISAIDSNTKIFDVDIYGLFVGTVAPGDLVQLTGIVRAELAGDAYKLKIECNNIQTIKNRNHFNKDSTFEADFQIFKNISEEKDLMNILIDTFYPNVFGNISIKTGLILSLFGGSRKYAGTTPIRSEIHVLIVGDPGLGKSKLLLSTCSVIPKSVYVSGNSCTTAGLTVSITHDPVTGEYMADAGALVVSDSGVCCIDEFDKIDDHTALYEAMEDQKVTVAKGGVCCSVPSRASVIAASNPRHGHFDPKKTIRENLKFDSSLLSRFDLVFILMDNLSERENYEIGNQILKKRHYSDSNKTSGEIENFVHSLRNGKSSNKENITYSKETLKKYIEYSRVTVHPVLSKAAKQKIKEYFIELRKNKSVSIRNLEALIRLTESYAKLELKSIASVSHASSAISLYKKMFISDEKQGDKKMSIESLLKEYVNNSGETIISKDELLSLIKQSGNKKSEVEVLEIMNFKGQIIKNSDGTYRILG